MIRGKYTFLISPLADSRLDVTQSVDRSKIRQHDDPARKNRKYGTCSDGTLSSRPNTTVLMKIGINGRAKSQNGPSVVPSYRSWTRCTAKNQAMRPYRHSSSTRAKKPMRV